MLVMDQKVTTQPVLGELSERGVRFRTLRMRSPALIRHINSLAPADYKTITLDRPGPHNKPKVHEDPAVKLTSYPGTVRQLVVTGLGRDAPTVIITNDDDTKVRTLIEQYARRMTIEQRLAEIIRAFCADALSSAVNLNVDLDIMLAVLAQALLAALRARLPGYAAVTPRHHPAPVPGNPRPDHHHQRRHHRPARTTRLLTGPAQGQPPRRHPHTLARRPDPPLRIPLNLAPNLLRGNPLTPPQNRACTSSMHTAQTGLQCISADPGARVLT
jgi:hypothetical protein